MPLSKRKVTSADELSSADEGVNAPAKKAKTLNPTKGIAGGEEIEVNRDDDGNAFWELTGKRRVTISEFKGVRMVSIREYYEKDGKDLPGKKGISLPLDQFSALISLLPQIDDQLKTKGDKLPRPAYEADRSMNGNEQDEDDGTAPSKQRRENHEETSDEE